MVNQVTASGCTIDPSSVRLRRWSWRCGFGLYILASVCGAVQILLPFGNLTYFNLTYFTMALLFATLATLWAAYDARSRHKPLVPAVQMLYFLAWPIGATIYLVFRSGWRSLLAAAMHGLGLMVTMYLAFYGTFYAIHFAGLLDRRYYE